MSWPVTGAKRARSNEASEEDDDEKGEEDRRCCAICGTARRRDCGGGGGGEPRQRYCSPFRPETAAAAWPSSSVEAALDWYEPFERARILLRALEALPIEQLRLFGHDLQNLADAAAACPSSPGSQGSMGDGGPEAGGEVLKDNEGEAAQ
jgi:hypothetical protein